MSFPVTRLRRLRQSESLRRLVRETRLSVDDLVQPFFVCSGKRVRRPISSLPGHFQLSVDELVKEVRACHHLGIPAVILFGLPKSKDAVGSEAYDPNGIIQRAIRAVKEALPEMIVIADLCFCEYTDHGHCGIVSQGGGKKGKKKRWTLDNDATLELITKTTVVQAEAGADIIAPSGMIDGQVRTIREALDQSGYSMTPILSYSAKYSSFFYGPFREAARSLPQFGDRRSYQMDPGNAKEAMREISEDIAEGADIVMVKPALAYLDVIRRVKEKFSIPVAAYNVSGEFAMVKAASAKKWVDGEKITWEILTAIKRAGADLIITYHAREIAKKIFFAEITLPCFALYLIHL